MKTFIWIQRERRDEEDIIVEDDKNLLSEDQKRIAIVNRIIEIRSQGKKISEETTFLISKLDFDYLAKLSTNKKDEYDRPLPAIILLKNVNSLPSLNNLADRIKLALRAANLEIEDEVVAWIVDLITTDLLTGNGSRYYARTMLIKTLIILFFIFLLFFILLNIMP